jgi:hypothetical protein
MKTSIPIEIFKHWCGKYAEQLGIYSSKTKEKFQLTMNVNLSKKWFTKMN